MWRGIIKQYTTVYTKFHIEPKYKNQFRHCWENQDLNAKLIYKFQKKSSGRTWFMFFNCFPSFLVFQVLISTYLVQTRSVQTIHIPPNKSLLETKWTSSTVETRAELINIYSDKKSEVEIGFEIWPEYMSNLKFTIFSIVTWKM